MFLGCSFQIKPITKFPLEKSPSYVYFITCDKPDFPIKFGMASSPKKRFSGLQVGLPYPITVLGVFPGGRDLEREMKLRFFPHRLNGEWYERTDHMLALIEEWSLKQRRRLGLSCSQKRLDELDDLLYAFVRLPPYPTVNTRETEMAEQICSRLVPRVSGAAI